MEREIAEGRRTLFSCQNMKYFISPFQQPFQQPSTLAVCHTVQSSWAAAKKLFSFANYVSAQLIAGRPKVGINPSSGKAVSKFQSREVVSFRGKIDPPNVVL